MFGAAVGRFEGAAVGAVVGELDGGEVGGLVGPATCIKGHVITDATWFESRP